MKAALRLAIIVLGLLHIAVPVVSAAPPALVEVRVNQPEDMTVGDHARYTIRLQGDSGTQFQLPPGALPAELELLAPAQVTERRLSAGRSDFTVTFVVAPFVPGNLQIPSLQIAYATPSGETGQINTGPTTIVVRSLLIPNTVPQPRDLKPQVEVGSPPANLQPYLIAAGALVAALTIGLIMLRRSRRKPAVISHEGQPAELTAEDRARRQLDELLPVLQRGELPVYYQGLSETVRGYLTERFGFPAFALTTTELHDRMLRQGIGRWQARLVSGLLSECDSVLFAQYQPASERSDANLSTAYEIVEISRPVSLDAEAAVEAAAEVAR